MATAPPRTVSRVQPFVATDWDILLRPGVGEGRNTMLRRGRCACQCLSPFRIGSAVPRMIEEERGNDLP